MKVIVFACLLLLGSAIARPTLEVSLSSEPSAPSWIINLKITNVGESPVAVLTWNTPFDSMQSDSFDIRDEAGNRAVYIGHIAKRGAPHAEDFLTFTSANKDGHTDSIAVDLSELYRLPHSNATYTVTFVGTILATEQMLDTIVRPAQPDTGLDYPSVSLDSLEVADVTSAPFSFWLHMALLRSPPRPPMLSGGLGMSYAATCGTLDQTKLESVVNTAKGMAQQCVNYLTASTCDAAFVKWFGRYTGSSRWSSVTRNFNNINNKIGSKNFGLNCRGPQCQPGTFAYVYPTDSSFVIYLCDQFWKSTSGISYDSQPGTIIHEMSHFSVIAGTQDHTYGTSGAQDFAARQADKAIGNADNHEYFAESSPRC